MRQPGAFPIKGYSLFDVLQQLVLLLQQQLHLLLLLLLLLGVLLQPQPCRTLLPQQQQ